MRVIQELPFSPYSALKRRIVLEGYVVFHWQNGKWIEVGAEPTQWLVRHKVKVWPTGDDEVDVYRGMRQLACQCGIDLRKGKP